MVDGGRAVLAPPVPAPRAAPRPVPEPAPAPSGDLLLTPVLAPAHPRSQPSAGGRGGAEAVSRVLARQLAETSRYGLLAGQVGEAVPERVRATLRDLIEAAFPHLRAGTPDWRAAVDLAATQAADVLGRYAVPLIGLPSTRAPGAREGVAALSAGIDALLVDAGVGVVLDLDAGTAAFRVQTPAGSTPSCGRAALLATCVVLLHLRLTQPLLLASLVTEGGTWLPVWRAARDLWTVGG